MFKNLIVSSIFLTSLQSFATTAVLCGNEEAVDADNDQALVWLILENFGSTSKDQVQVAYSGKDAQVKTVTSKDGVLSITTSKPTSKLSINESDINPARCELGSNFSVTVETSTALESIGECRCFQD